MLRKSIAAITIRALAAALAAALALCASMTAAAQDRGLSVMARSIVGSDDFDVGRQYAVIIGIDTYDEWPSLRGAAAEAKAVKRALSDRYYIDEFIELYDKDATAAGIRRLFVDVLPKKVGLNDSLLIFYAGHGYLDDSKTGFWIASDGDKDVYSQRGWIPNAQLRNYVAGLKVQRVLLIADACFSGDFLNVTRGAGPRVDSEYFKKALRLSARQVLTSGSSETVPDESEFGRQLVSLLERNADSVLDTHTMFDRIRRGVTKTDPLIGTIPGNEAGATFALFLRPVTGSLRVAVATDADIYVDGTKAGRAAPGAPVTVSGLAAGERRVEARYASSAEDAKAVVVPGVSVDVSLSYRPPLTGGLALIGFPDGAVLYLDGKPSGEVSRGSLSLDGLGAGAVKARVSHRLWPDAQEFDARIEPGAVASLRLSGGSVVVSGLALGVELYLGEAFIARTVQAGERLVIGPLPTGTYRLRLSGSGYESSELSVFVPAGDDVLCSPVMRPLASSLPQDRSAPPASAPAAAIAPTLASEPASLSKPSYGVIDLSLVPPGYVVYSGDKKLGVTPIARMSFQAGDLRLRFERSGEASREYGATVSADWATRVPWGSRPDLPLVLMRRSIDLKKPESWDGIPPILAPERPMRASAGVLTQEGMGITKVYICRDDKYLYWRIDFESVNPVKKIPKGAKKAIGVEFGIDFETSKNLRVGIYHNVEKNVTYSFLGIQDGRVWKHVADDVVSLNKEAASLILRVPNSTISKYISAESHSLRLYVFHDTGSGWEYGSLATPTFYVDFSK